jgi:tetraacyldisaccharide 4'-kinase
MLQKLLIQILLSPLALIFGLGVSIKNLLYTIVLLKGVSFSIPMIGVGNLTVGGAGKSPHVEYLIRLLKDYLQIATLSRGYKRKTRGFLQAEIYHTADIVGDEPLQFKRKFPEISVAVAENRALGVPKLLQVIPDLQVILLDDIYQHRAIQPGLNILLTEHHHLFTKDFLLPVGRLREWRSAYKRADILVVTKCPENLSPTEKSRITSEISPISGQSIFFSRYQYLPLYNVFNPSARGNLNNDVSVLLVCAIARTQYLLDYLQEKASEVKMLQFEDHHTFNRYDLEQIKKYYDTMPEKKKIILTTEKDAVRLELHRNFFLENKLPVFALPIKVEFLFGQEEQFNEKIKDFLLAFKV